MKSWKRKRWLSILLVLAMLICPCVEVLAEGQQGEEVQSGAEEDECPAGGKHIWKEYTHPASCTSAGEKYQICSACHLRQTLETYPKLPHDYKEVTEYPVSCKDSLRKFECNNCGNKYSISSTAFPSADMKHSWTSPDDGWVPLYGDEPSCRKAGTLIRKCADCGYTETKPGTQQEHQPMVSPTDCTRKVCKVCGTDLGPSGDQHQVDNWVHNGPLTAEGEHIGTCTKCGKTVREGHVYKDDNDCTTPVVCQKCGLVIVAGNSEHNKYPLFHGDGSSPYYTGRDNGNGTHTRYCSNEGCNQVTNVSEPHEFVNGECTVCGAIGSSQQCNHNWSETFTVTATCQNQGKTYRKCLTCGIQEDLTVTSRTGHSYGEWKVTKKATCTTPGEQVRACTTPGCTAVERKTIAASGHKSQSYDCGTEKCSVCGAVLKNGKNHDVQKWSQDLTQSGKHFGVCKECHEKVYEKHVGTDDGNCMTAVTCTKCGAVIQEASEGHNLYPQFDDGNHPYYEGKDNGDGTHTRICSNEGCTKTTGVKENHQFKDGTCTVCGAKDESKGGTTSKASKETNSQGKVPGKTTSSASSSERKNSPANPEGTTPPAGAESTNPPADPEGTTPPAESEPVGSGEMENTGSNTQKPAASLPVTVELPEGTSETAALTVVEVTETNESVKEVVTKLFNEYVAYDLTLFDGNAVVQPNGTVKVTLKLPEGWANVDVYHVDGDTMTRMSTTVENGNAVFTTTHFSVYVLVNNESVAASPEPQETMELRKTSEEVQETQEADPADPAEPAVVQSPKTGEGGAKPAAAACTVAAVFVVLLAGLFFVKRSRSAR